MLDELIATEQLRSEAGELFAQVLSQKPVHKIGQRLRKDGQMVDVELHGVPLVIDGEVQGGFALYQDISERLNAEKALRESEELFRTLSAAAPIGIFMTDNMGDCRYINQRWTEMTGLSAEESMGQGWIMAIHPEDREQMRRSGQRRRETESCMFPAIDASPITPRLCTLRSLREPLWTVLVHPAVISVSCRT